MWANTNNTMENTILGLEVGTLTCQAGAHKPLIGELTKKSHINYLRINTKSRL